MKPLTVRPSPPVEMEATGITPDAKMSEALARMHNRHARARGTRSVVCNVSVRSAQQESQQDASHIGARCTACPLCSSRRRAATCAASSRSACTQATPKLFLKPRAAKMLQPRISTAKVDPRGLCAGARARRPAAHPHHRGVVRLRTRVRGPPRAPRCLLRTARRATCCMVGAPSFAPVHAVCPRDSDDDGFVCGACRPDAEQLLDECCASAVPVSLEAWAALVNGWMRLRDTAAALKVPLFPLPAFPAFRLPPAV